jgi:phage virion morphogenesis protein
MSGVTVTVDTAEVTAALDRLVKLGADPSPALKNVGVHLVQSTQERFQQEKAPDGSAWPALDPDYRAGKRGPGILREAGMRGGLMGSITWSLQGQRLTVGTNKVYAAIHQFGGTIKPKTQPALIFRIGGRLAFARQVTLPARPFLGVSAEDAAEIQAIFEDFAEMATRERGNGA